jgi:contractile injection system tube protein/LysM domain-containing protein
MAVVKLRIKALQSEFEDFEVPFNPTEYSISKSVKYKSTLTSTLNAPGLTFSGGESRQLKLNLFFDVTEPIGGKQYKDVRQLTNKFVAITRIKRNRDNRPPVCIISWGSNPPENSDFPFRGVITDLTQNFIFFASDGRPLRAKLDVTFTEDPSIEEDQRRTDPDFTTRIIKSGDTLSGIAFEVYKDPTRWRIIADANNLDNPRHLEIGKPLSIPKTA